MALPDPWGGSVLALGALDKVTVGISFLSLPTNGFRINPRLDKLATSAGSKSLLE